MATAKDYSLGPNIFPRGWFVIAESSELKTEPLALSFFEKDFALYRGESGKPILLDAHCPHMGTHIAAGETAFIALNKQQIEGDSIRCPYHGWRFNAEGQCDDIPYQENDYPRSALINSYPVVESMGCIMMWHDTENNEPEYDAPCIDEWHDDSWVKWSLDHCGTLPIHSIEIIDNMADLRHLDPTHGAKPSFFENEIDGHRCIQRQAGYHEDYNDILKTITWYEGPGLLISKQDYGDISTYEMIANTPTLDGEIKIWHGVLYQSKNVPPTVDDIASAKAAQQQALAILSADFSIWKNKKPAIRVLQIKNDGPFNICRKWYSQFFLVSDDAKGLSSQINGKYYVNEFPSFDDIA